MAEPSFTKRRVTPRFGFCAKAEVTLDDGTLIFGQSSQLSSRGCYIETVEAIPVMTEFRVRISDGTSSCKLAGRVIYAHSRDASGIFGIGVAFGKMTLDQYVAIVGSRPSPHKSLFRKPSR